jgi:hypothetical protein
VIRAGLAAVALLVALLQAMTGRLGTVVPTGLNISPPVSSDTLIQSTTLVYAGAFKVPTSGFAVNTPNGAQNLYTGAGITFSAAGNNGLGSLFLFGTGGRSTDGKDTLIAEITIPTPVIATDTTPAGLSQLSRATALQGFYSGTDGTTYDVTDPRNAPGGLLVFGASLLVSHYIAYDGGNQGVKSHWTHSLTLSNQASAVGPLQLGTLNTNHPAGLMGGAMATIPAAWWTPLGGKAMTGLSNVSIISRSSAGPAAFAFDPADLGVTSPVPTSSLVYYPSGHQLQSNVIGRSNTLYNTAMQQYPSWGLAFPSNHRSVLFVAAFGTGNYNYGEGTQNLSADPVTTSVSGSDASTNAAGTIVTLPGQTAALQYIWLSAQTTPALFDDGSHNGVAAVMSRTGSAYTVSPAFSGTLTAQAYKAGELQSYDAVNGAKGPHAWPYVTRMYAYDANDLAAAKAGTISPWDVRPYATWDLTFPFMHASLSNATHLHKTAGMAYDDAHHTLYIAHYAADPTAPGNLPVIHVFTVSP